MGDQNTLGSPGAETRRAPVPDGCVQCGYTETSRSVVICNCSRSARETGSWIVFVQLITFSDPIPLDSRIGKPPCGSRAEAKPENSTGS